MHQAEDDAQEELLEKGLEDVRIGGAEDENSHEGGHRTVPDGDTHVLERANDAFVRGASLFQVRATDVRR